LEEELTQILLTRRRKKLISFQDAFWYLFGRITGKFSSEDFKSKLALSSRFLEFKTLSDILSKKFDTPLKESDRTSFLEKVEKDTTIFYSNPISEKD